MYESMYGMAERARFELAEACTSTVFKTVYGTRDDSPSLTEDEAGEPQLTPESMYESMYVVLGPAPCIQCRALCYWNGSQWVDRAGLRHRCAEKVAA